MLRNRFYFIITFLLWSSKLRVIQETNQSIDTLNYWRKRAETGRDFLRSSSQHHPLYGPCRSHMSVRYIEVLIRVNVKRDLLRHYTSWIFVCRRLMFFTVGFEGRKRGGLDVVRNWVTYCNPLTQERLLKLCAFHKGNSEHERLTAASEARVSKSNLNHATLKPSKKW